MGQETPQVVIAGGQRTTHPQTLAKGHRNSQVPGRGTDILSSPPSQDPPTPASGPWENLCLHHIEEPLLGSSKHNLNELESSWRREDQKGVK